VDYYLVLGVAENATEETIRTAFRALARRFHPDVGAGSSPVEFQRAREAYETLVDPERRRRYDRQLRASRARPAIVEELLPFVVPRPCSTVTASSLFDDVLEEFFASFGDNWFHRDWVRSRRRG
jgi:DnaJ-class molecular chaperone